MLDFALVIRFSLEICLVAIGLWFPWNHSTGVTALAGSLAIVVGLVLTWGMLLSPKRRLEIGGTARLLLEAILFSAAAAALATGGHWQLAAALIAIAIVDKLVLILLEGHA